MSGNLNLKSKHKTLYCTSGFIHCMPISGIWKTQSFLKWWLLSMFQICVGVLCVEDLLLSKQRTETGHHQELHQYLSLLERGNKVSWGGVAVYIPHEQTIECTGILYCTAKKRTNSSKAEWVGRKIVFRSQCALSVSRQLHDASNS